jgi:hypothetical protein
MNFFFKTKIFFAKISIANFKNRVSRFKKIKMLQKSEFTIEFLRKINKFSRQIIVKENNDSILMLLIKLTFLFEKVYQRLGND